MLTPCKAEQGMELQKKRSTKRLTHTGNLFRNNIEVIGIIANSRLKPFRL